MNKEVWDIVGNGKLTGSVQNETIEVSATISISVKNSHSRIRLRALSCNRMWEMRREPEVPEERVPVVECLDGPARITSKELAPINSFCESGILQNACFYKSEWLQILEKSAIVRIARLKDNLAKGPKRMVTKVQWPNWRKVIGKKENLLPTNVTKLITEQSVEIYGINTISWEDSSWRNFSFVGDEEVISLLHTKGLRILSFCHVPWKDEREPHQIMHGKTNWRGSKVHKKTELWTELMGSQWWNIFPGFTTLQLSHKVRELLSRLDVTPENFTKRIIFMSMFNDISWRSKDNEKESESNARIVSLYARRFGAGQWSFLGPGSEKKWYSWIQSKVNGTKWLSWWC